ncbi:hypothetical protein BH11ACT4_BH11ACT4_01110 [soil metagenome]
MRSLTSSKPAAAAFAGLTLVGALAGCTATASTTAQAPQASSTSSGSTTAGTVKDGTYTESADYQAPSGTEKVDVTLTLAGGVVTAVTVTGHATDPEAKLHQGQFAGGIAAVVVGKKITELKVDKVGGSSLTSGGFNKAVELIKADATS